MTRRLFSSIIVTAGTALWTCAHNLLRAVAEMDAWLTSTPHPPMVSAPSCTHKYARSSSAIRWSTTSTALFTTSNFSATSARAKPESIPNVPIGTLAQRSRKTRSGIVRNARLASLVISPQHASKSFSTESPAFVISHDARALVFNASAPTREGINSPTSACNFASTASRFDMRSNRPLSPTGGTNHVDVDSNGCQSSSSLESILTTVVTSVSGSAARTSSTSSNAVVSCASPDSRASASGTYDRNNSYASSSSIFNTECGNSTHMTVHRF
mmetsp:Transcript_4326/g.14322  ORF Transcript_4326/g.14322 Transcript_4326/m.14322 type:complete len:271 (+) Transcript_4326:188-1000(+)